MVRRNWLATPLLPIGTRILSIAGECDQNDDASWNETGPNAIGVVQIADRHNDGEPYYQVVFEESGCAVHLDQFEIEDAAIYRVVP